MRHVAGHTDWTSQAIASCDLSSPLAAEYADIENGLTREDRGETPNLIPALVLARSAGMTRQQLPRYH